MSFVDRMLDTPGYGYTRNGQFYKPSTKELWREFFSRLNPFNLHNWVNIVAVTINLSFVGVFFYNLIVNFSWPLLIGCYLYSMFIMSSHFNFWIHRYLTHSAFKFRNNFLRWVCSNLVPKMLAEEVYVISHHVHHHKPEQPGDPYNALGGFLYCFLADVNHQGINKDLSPDDYARLCRLMTTSGIRFNTYKQYKRWGTIVHPLYLFMQYAVNWSAWFAITYLIGGPVFTMAVFGSAGFWALIFRPFGYGAHGGGRDLRKDGIDFNRADLSVNKRYTGILTGEWHNNHHLYPRSARTGFMPGQFDLPWEFTRFLHAIGVVTSYRDDKAEFYAKHVEPHEAAKKSA